MQISGTRQLQFGQRGMALVSLILPEHHHVILPASLHGRVSVTAMGLTRTSLLVVATTYDSNHLRKWVRAPPHPLRCCLSAQCTNIWTPSSRHPGGPSSSEDEVASPDIITLNVQSLLRPKHHALDTLLREHHFPIAVESGPRVLQTIHPLYQSAQVLPRTKDAPPCSGAPST